MRFLFKNVQAHRITMLFNSIPFLFFFIIFFSLWPLLKKKNSTRWAYITFTSLFFYSWWDWRFSFLIIGSGLLDYACGLGMNSQPKFKKSFLLISLVGNVGSLSIFKYSSFFAEIIEKSTSVIGLEVNLVSQIPEFALILPVGISFYTFQSMSYTIDVYKGEIKPTKNILHFFSYLCMFPQLVAGPIVRAKDFLPQLKRIPKVNSIQIWNGSKLIVFGMFQKIVIADNVGLLVDTAFTDASVHNSSPFWITVMLSFTLQIYFDFSGYSLIARGIAKLMGYHFKMNFNHPYHSKSFREFWSRWHISLSKWFRDYVYIPLGGSRNGFFNGLIFMLITMAISGIWHGANYTFIIWGLLHGLYLGFERLLSIEKRIGSDAFLTVIYRIILLTSVILGWVFFRADSLDQAISVLNSLFSVNFSLDFVNLYINSISFLILGICLEIGVYFFRKYHVLKFYYKRHNLDIISILGAIYLCLYFRGPDASFIYFQF